VTAQPHTDRRHATGSLPTAKTIGMVRVAAFAAKAAVVVFGTAITGYPTLDQIAEHRRNPIITAQVSKEQFARQLPLKAIREEAACAEVASQPSRWRSSH
jgi:hypothetical protein